MKQIIPNAIVVMGVSGSGKSTVARELARKIRFDFVEGDDLHPPENVTKMSTGQPLNDTDRLPWLQAICRTATRKIQSGHGVVISCSALKKSYRNQLRSISQQIQFVFLDGSFDEILKRMEMRTGHFMPAALLQSQFADLENPQDEADVLSINNSREIEAVVEDVNQKIFGGK